MKQERFEVEIMHPLVAALLIRDGWFYHHEYPLSDRKRADFLAIQPRTGRVAIVECKVSISSTDDLIDQIEGYHHRLGYAPALKWAFVWNAPHSGTIRRLRDKRIGTFSMDEEAQLDPADLGEHSKLQFKRAYNQLKPTLDRLQEIRMYQRSLVHNIRSIYQEPS